MKNRSIALFVVLAMAVSAGISCVYTLASPENTEQTDMASAHPDRLIGIYLTEESIHSTVNLEMLLQQDSDSAALSDSFLTVSSTEEGKIYAVIEERTGGDNSYTDSQCVFPGIEGFGMFSYTLEENGHMVSYTDGGDVISDRHSAFISTDHGEKIELTGTLYSSVEKQNSVVWIHPVYQEADGDVYLIPGTGVAYTSGGVIHSMDETQTEEIDGETVVTYEAHIKLHFEQAEVPALIRVLEFAGDGTLIDQTDWQMEKIPSSFTPDENTAYIITQSHTSAGTVIERALWQKTDSLLKFLCPAQNDFLVLKYAELHWE